MKKTKTETFKCALSPHSLNGNIKDAIARLKILLDEYGPDAKLYWDSNFYYDYDSNPSPTFHITRDRLETDQEYNERLVVEAERKAAIEKKERELLDQLQRKYNNQ